jgi:hypothetical protein
LNKFGEGNLVIIGVKTTPFLLQKPRLMEQLMNSIKGDRAVDLVVSLNDLKKLQKNDSLETLNWFRSTKAKPLNASISKIRKELLMTCLLRRIAL